jgi:hypothetical protein
MTEKQIPHKVTEKQLQLIEAMKTTGNLKELQKIVKWQGRELHNMIGYFVSRKFIRRISKSTYVLNYSYLYDNVKESFEEVETDGLKIDLNLIPKEIQDYLWENRQKTCSELKLKTKLPRLYIRQYIYEMKLKHFPRNSKSL